MDAVAESEKGVEPASCTRFNSGLENKGLTRYVFMVTDFARVSMGRLNLCRESNF